MKETQFVAKFRKLVLNRHACSVLNVHGHMMQGVGWPDMYICQKIMGQFWIEFKVHPNKLSKVQEQRIDELRRKNVPVFVITLEEEYIRLDLGVLEDRTCYALAWEKMVNLLCEWTRILAG